MDRRRFFTRALPLSTLPFLIGGMAIRAYGRSPFLDGLLASADLADRVLVLIQMTGGNDGLNMVIPRDQYPVLTIARNNILIPEAAVLPLDTDTGFHPKMSRLHQMYAEGKVAVIQGVSYPNPNFSHFRATDIWLSGADYNQTRLSGVMGRYLDAEFPDFPTGYPTVAMPDPLAISVGSTASPGFQGPSVNMGMAISDPNSSYLLPGGSDVAPSTPAGHELIYVRRVAEQTQVYSATVRTANAKAKNLATYPTPNSLADQLKIVARLIAGGLRTRVYVVTIGGFDTHSAQVDTADHGLGTHATLLERLSLAIGAFQQDLELLGVDRRVVGLTFSEFGRRIKSNASVGTDHGTSIPMIVFGSSVNGGKVGTNPVLGKIAAPKVLTDVKDNLDMQFDFRQVYGTILLDWFGAPANTVSSVLSSPLFTSSAQPLPLITPEAKATGGTVVDPPRKFLLAQNYPNPFNPTTTIRYELPEAGHVSLTVYSVTGQRVAELVEGQQSAGVHAAVFNAGALSSGTYIYRLVAGSQVETKKMVVLK